MKSSTGKYYVGLDHVRALAAFMVFTWHFIGQFSPPAQIPFSLLTEGHTGVALFMTLSGYLFAKLLGGRKINFASFLWNRFLPAEEVCGYAELVSWGLIIPSLPNGGWSITVEFHFYLALPLLLLMSAKSKFYLPLFVAGMIILRTLLYLKEAPLPMLAFHTIIGRADQFVLGILAYQHRNFFKGRHLVALAIFLGFAVFYWKFDSLGGYYKMWRESNAIWIYMTTVEGIAYASLIAWYDNSFNHSTGRFSRFIALIGTYSYSIYLLHFFFIYDVPPYVDQHLISLTNPYVALLVAPFAFLLMIPFGWASYKFVESPFLKYRTKYVADRDESSSENDSIGISSPGRN